MGLMKVKRRNKLSLSIRSRAGENVFDLKSKKVLKTFTVIKANYVDLRRRFASWFLISKKKKGKSPKSVENKSKNNLEGDEVNAQFDFLNLFIKNLI